MLLQLLFLTSAAHSAWTSDPTVNLAVAPSSHDQKRPQIVADGNGGVYVAWEDEGDSLAPAIHPYVQHVTAAGLVDPAWPDTGFFLNPGHDVGAMPVIASDGRGGVISAWTDVLINLTSGSTYRAQRLDSSGTPQWGPSGMALTVTRGSGASGGVPGILVPDSSGGAIAVWSDSRYSLSWHNVFAQRVNRDGAAIFGSDGVRVCPGAWQQLLGTVVPDSEGGAFVAWNDSRQGYPFSIVVGVYAQHVDGNGNLLWPSAGLALSTPTIRGAGRVQGCSDGQGGAYIAWWNGSTHRNGDLYMTRLLPSGAPASGWSLSGNAVDTFDDAPDSPLPVPDGAGGVFVEWTGTRSGATSIYGQHFNADGTIQWAANGIELGAYNAGLAAPIPDGRGGIIGARSEAANQGYCAVYSHIYSQHLDANGTPLWGPLGRTLSVGCGRDNPLVACSDSAGGLIAVWPDYRDVLVQGNFNHANLYAQRIAADGSLGGDVVDALLSLAGVDATPERISLRWFTSDRSIGGAEVERNAGDGWSRMAHVSPDGDGILTYQDTDVTPGQRYGYRLSVEFAGRASAMGEAWVTVPVSSEFALRSVQPNPSSGALMISFALPARLAATLELLDVAGRRVASRDVSALGAGSHVVSFAREASTLRPGVYTVRLRAGERSASIRAVLIR